MQPPTRTAVVVTAVTVAVSFLTVCVPVASAQATPSAGGPSPWAYGALSSRSWSGAFGQVGFRADETLGFATVLHETTGQHGLIALDVNRTMGVLLSVTFCRPNCRQPVDSASVAFHAWESIAAQLLLTTEGNVTIALEPAPALALVASNVSVDVGLKESTATVVNGTEVAGHNLSIALDANASTEFAPALGLLPLNLSAGTTWSASSVFTTTGAASWSVLEQFVNLASISGSGNLSLNASGAVLLTGSDAGATVGLSGGRYHVVTLAIVGPFALREGFLLIPTNASYFGTSAPSWLPSSVNELGSASFSAGNVDVATPLAAGSHVGFAASEIAWTYATGDPLTLTTSAGGLAPAVASVSPGASDTNTTTVQGSPESVAQATTDQGCLASGLGCPGPGGPRSPLTVLIVAGAVAAVAVLALAVVAERRRVPPPSYPNAALYPPGAAAATTRGPGRREAPPAAPAEDDPLSHLW
jgi:hypothetical protein